MKQERMYYGVYAVIEPKDEPQLTELIQSHKGKKFGQGQNILGIFGKVHYAAQTALLFLQDCLKEPTCTYSVLILKGSQASLVHDAKQLARELPPGCCMVTKAALESLQEHNPITEPGLTLTNAVGDLIKLYTLQGCGDILLDDQAAASLFDFSGVEPKQAQSDEHPSSSVTAKNMSRTSNLVSEEPYDEPITNDNDDLEIATDNQIYSPPTPQDTDEDQNAPEDDPEATEPPFMPDSMPSINIDAIKIDMPEAPLPSISTSPMPEASAEFYPSPTVTQGYSMPHFPDPWHVRWRNNSVLFWGSIITGFIFFATMLWIILPKESAPAPALSIEEEERSLFDDQPLYPEEEQEPAYRTVLTSKEAKSKVLDLGKTTFPQVAGANTAFMEIISKPEGATVTIDGKTLSEKTPLPTFLVYANKKMDVIVSKPGHINAQRDVTIDKHQRRGLLFILTEE